ncbi:unnamed protein product [Euphydryas editha]|uniref:Uncharacterized protein n=1 Tax=Euphydryas editha TaxID=104508 RepID=A0AAU9TFX1_EUPED|nr:unnamed protein product [Euphydryas editha]
MFLHVLTSSIPSKRNQVYIALFKPLRVSRRQFRRVLMCMRNVRHLKCHELYAHEKVTKVDSLSLVLSGK